MFSAMIFANKKDRGEKKIFNNSTFILSELCEILAL